MTAHAAPHPVIPTTALPVVTCSTCGRLAVYVEDVSRVRPHWRHKGAGYHWGDVARRLEAENRELRARLAAVR